MEGSLFNKDKMYPTIAAAVLAIFIVPIDACYDEASKTGTLTACQLLDQNVDVYMSCMEELPDLNTSEVDMKRDMLQWVRYLICYAKAMDPYVATDVLMNIETLDACQDEVLEAFNADREWSELACMKDV